ncbi:DegT/DnrJ/EryC1/StrS aminotransferase family protein [Magnetospirillum sp. UT-4]|uniref:DegT/DnrJ/EryC1/StrS family aminotransferase n=1 Tax=Magnetospirillum sp. UT-4 TaxID=2681467 RepID=UPI001384EF8F|nr:DegT/DnrJ/EryC1/StrS family aminotransferase [Magnetospirillum sp. UT-4]CAA7612135.1 Glutamine--scyllo-inositol transaminase [Magnetospirillum sp. UT-4]
MTPSIKLALHGGPPVRRVPMPLRRAMGPAEEHMVAEVLDHYRRIGQDPGYQGPFEDRYTAAFAAKLGGGFADSVATGTAALYVALAALGLPPGSKVLCSPITDPGTLSAIILNGLVPRLMDSEPGSYNIGAGTFAARLAPDVRAAVVVHATGQAVDMDGVMAVARQHGIRVLEDCSQAHGACWKGRPVGTFGDIAAFSTMNRKAHITGGSGGVVFTRDRDLYHMALAHADRGKPVWQEGFDWRNPAQFLFPALNLHTDEISCAIGLASLERLDETIVRRLAYVAGIAGKLRRHSRACTVRPYSPGDSPFIIPVFVDAGMVSCDKMEFAHAVRAEGIDLNPHYEYVAATWPFLAGHLDDDFATPNAARACADSFVLYVNENYGETEVSDTVAALRKVEAHYTGGDAADGQ